MKVSELIKLLTDLKSPDREVIIASDSEGNSFARLEDHSFSLGAYAKSDGEIVIGMEKLTAKLKKEGYTEDDVLEGGKPAVILYP